LIQARDGLKAQDTDNDYESKFTSVFVTQAINPCVLPRSLTAFQVIPYDAYCPSVQSVLLRRTCKKCGLYHASLTSMKVHNKTCGIQDVVAPVRPVRIAARRQREMMAIITYDQSEDAEWIDEEFLDINGEQ
jgi:hypothetical protein